MIAFYVGVLSRGNSKRVEHGEAVMESAVELQLRAPRLTDAWRFFLAASMLKNAGMTELSARAQRIGARIALAVTGWIVTDMCLAESGATAGLGLYVEGAEVPVILEFKDAQGRTVMDTP